MFKRKQIQHLDMFKLSDILIVIWLFTKQFGAYILTNCMTPFIKLKPLLKHYLKKAMPGKKSLSTLRKT